MESQLYKCFEGMDGLQLTSDGVVGIRSKDGVAMDLNEAVPTALSVERWLSLVSRMQSGH